MERRRTERRRKVVEVVEVVEATSQRFAEYQTSKMKGC